MDNFVKEFQKKVAKKQAKIAVVGLGYVGLPLAIEFAKKGFSVLGLELDSDRLKSIQQRKSYITDISTQELKKVIKSGNFSATAQFSALRKADVILICVPTPLKKKYCPDIHYIKQAVRSIARNLKKKSLVILESTTYPGTTEEVILPLLEHTGAKHGRDFYLSFSPERIDPGNKLYPVHKIPKVVGGISPEAAFMVVAVYGSIIEKVVPVSSTRVAEVVKLLENTFRLINIGMIDELAMMAHKMNIDIWEAVEAAATKPFGFMPFYPGPGVGGHCIPKDPLYLYWKAKKFGFQSHFIKLASDIISNMPVYVVERAKEAMRMRNIRLKAARILVVGTTYKKDIKDLRQSPALDIIEVLQKNKFRVAYYDPLIPYLKFHGINLKSIEISAGALAKFDCVIIATDHSALDYGLILKKSKIILDTRNVYRKSRDKKVVKL